jgi:chromosome segregation ATPase
MKTNHGLGEKMLIKDETKKKLSSFADELDGRFEKALAGRKEDVDKQLDDKIRDLKEEADLKIRQIKEEIDQEKNELKRQFNIISELEEGGAELKNQIRGRADQAAQYKNSIWKLTESLNTEWSAVKALDRKFQELRFEANDQVKSLIGHLEKLYGLETRIPESDILQENSDIDASRDMAALGKIRELLGSPDPSLPADSSAGKETSS